MLCLVPPATRYAVPRASVMRYALLRATLTRASVPHKIDRALCHVPQVCVTRYALPPVLRAMLGLVAVVYVLTRAYPLRVARYAVPLGTRVAL